MTLPQVLRTLLVLMVFVVIPFVVVEGLVRTRLYDHTLYTNSDALDRGVSDFAARDARTWRVLLLGDSEVRWGVDPRPLEEELSKQAGNVATMNFGIDGFSSGWMAWMSQAMRLRERMPELRVVAFGVQLIENHQLVEDQNVCNALEAEGGFQSAVFRSSFARDWGLTRHCLEGFDPVGWVVRRVEDAAAVVRYRSDVRALVFGRSAGAPTRFGLQSTALAVSFNGYQPHFSIPSNPSFEEDFQRAKDEIADEPHRGQPLAPDAWDALLAPRGYFDVLREPYQEEGIVVVFFALPTNPILIDEKNRRQTYALNSQRLAAYAERTGVVYFDLGVKDAYDAQMDFSDHRHLSDLGAAKFGRELGAVMAANPKVRAALQD